MEWDGFRELMRSAQAGDRETRQRLSTLTLPIIETAVRKPRYRRSCPADSVSHWVQDVCLRVLEKLPQFEGARKAAGDEQAWYSYRKWVKAVTRSAVYLAAEHDKRHTVPARPLVLSRGADDGTGPPQTPEPEGREPGPSWNLRGAEDALKVAEALEQLPPGERRVIELHYFQGMSLRQIALENDLSLDEVRKRHRQALGRLEPFLKGLEP